MKIVRGIVLTVLLILLFGLVGGMLAKFTNGYKNWDVEQWFVTSAVSTVSDVKNGGSFVQNDSKIDPIDVPSVPDEVQDPEDPTEPSGPEDPVDPSEPEDPNEPDIGSELTPSVFYGGEHLYLNPDYKDIVSEVLSDLDNNASELKNDYSLALSNLLSDNRVELSYGISYPAQDYGSDRHVLAVVQVVYVDEFGETAYSDYLEISICPLTAYWDYIVSIPGYANYVLDVDLTDEFFFIFGERDLYSSTLCYFHENKPEYITTGSFAPGVDFFPSDLMSSPFIYEDGYNGLYFSEFGVSYIVPGEENLFYSLFQNVPFEE